MISMRHHLISLAAVFLALAVGIVLGSSSLSERLLSHVGNERDSLSKQVDDLSTRNAALQARVDGSERFSAATAPLAVRDELAGRGVVVISSWDVAPEDRDGARRMIESAGGKVTGDVRLTEAVADPDRADQLRRIVTRLLPAGAQLPTATDAGTLTGGLLGPLAMSDNAGRSQVGPPERAAALSGLSEGGFATSAGELQPAPLALVLTGGQLHGEGAGSRASVLARLATQLDRSGAGAVLAGRTGSAEGAGPVGVARADGSIASGLSTVDDLESPQGRAAVVFALREQLDHRAGHYGTAGNADGVVPEIAN